MDSIETMLSAIIGGKPNTMLITFNDHWYYPDQEIIDDDINWISLSERNRAMKQNTVWTVQYYTGDSGDTATPLSLSASTLPAVLAVVLRRLEMMSKAKTRPSRAKPTRAKPIVTIVAKSAEIEPPAASNVLPFVRPVRRK